MGEGAEGGREDLQEREEALHLGLVSLSLLLVSEFVHGDDLDLIGIDERNLTAVVGDACGRKERGAQLGSPSPRSRYGESIAKKLKRSD